MVMATVEQSFSGQGELGELFPFIQQHFSNLSSFVTFTTTVLLINLKTSATITEIIILLLNLKAWASSKKVLAQFFSDRAHSHN